MKQNLLSATSLLSILFMTFHFTSDTLRARAGTPEAGGSTLIAVPILVVWLYGTLVLAERRSGYIIMLIGSVLALGMPVMHVVGAGGVFRGVMAKSNGDFLFVWTLHALGVTGMFSLILSVSALWRGRRSERGKPSGQQRAQAEAGSR
jgi:H+/gluconate symporter-like permease